MADFEENMLPPGGEGLTESFLKLIMANQRRIFAFIVTLVPNQTDAEDLLQETIMVMWRRFSEYRPGTDFVAWGITIARYKVLGHRKRYAASRVYFTDEVVDLLERQSPAMLEQMDSRVDALRRCLRKLNDRDIHLIRLRYAGGLTFKSMSDRLGRSAQSIHKSLARVHNALIACVRKALAMEEAI